MPEDIGRGQTIIIGLESSWATEATITVSVPVLEFNPNLQLEKMQEDVAAGRIEKGLSHDIVKKWSEPSMSVIVYQDHIGFFLKAIFGSLTSNAATPEAGVTTHDFTVLNDQDPESLSIKYEDNNQEEVILGAVVNTAEILMINGEYAKIDLTFMAKYPATDSDAASFTAENPFTACMATVKFAANVAGIGAAATIPFQEAKLNINKNAELIFGIGDCEPTKGVNKSFEVTGDFALVMTAETQRDLFTNNTDQAIQFDLTNSDVTIGAVTNPSLTFVLANVNITSWEQSTALDDLISETFGFVANYLLTDNMIDCALVNTKASYVDT